MFIVLLSLSKSLAHVAKVSDQKKCLPLNEEPCMIRPTLINLNLLEVEYYTFRIKTKDRKVNIFNVITNKNDAKPMIKHMSRDCKCKFTV